MKSFKKVINEINSTLNSILLFGVFLNTIIFFLASYIIIILTGFKPRYALYPALGYFIVMACLKFKENKIRKVEVKYKALDEKLRTAADNINLENPVVEDLQKELFHDIRNVEVAYFLDTRKISSRIIAAVVLCFMVLYLTSIDIQPIEIQSLVQGISSIGTGSAKNQTPNVFSGGPGGAGNTPSEGEIFGVPSWISLGKREEEINIGASGYEVSVRDIKEAQKQSFDEQFPDEVFVQGASAYEEKIPREQQEIVKNYFEKLTQS